MNLPIVFDLSSEIFIFVKNVVQNNMIMKTSKIKNGLVVMAFILSVLPVWGHSDWGFTKDFGNVRVTYSCGFSNHEERYKSHIIAQLVEILSKELDCKQIGRASCRERV